MNPFEIIAWGIGLGVPLVSIITAIAALLKSRRNGHHLETHDEEIARLRRDVIEYRQALDACIKARIHLEQLLGQEIARGRDA
jgi:hypothetical protein